ncbi:MAG: OprD family outer membrane porin [Sulfuricurvum sp.]
MRHTVRLSLLASIIALSASGADDLAGMFKEGKVSGQFRTFYINRDISFNNSANDYSRDALSVGGKLNYQTGSFNGLSMGATFYTTNKIDNKSSIAKKNDATLFDSSTSNGYSYLGEAYLQYKNGNTSVKLGRQELNTPLAGGDDARMLPNTFEAVVLSNTDVKDTTLIAAHVTRINYGTFANAYPGGELALTSGYGRLTPYDSGQFQNMGMAAIGDNTAGVTTLAALYSGIPGLKLQLWDYYAHDILNAIYAEANYGVSLGTISPYVGVQYIKEDDVGSNNVITKVNSDFIAGKLGAKIGNFDIYGAISHNSEDKNAAVSGGTISPWGGMPAYTQGMVTRHQFLSGTDAWKVAGTYNFKDMGANVSASVYYTSFDVGNLSTYTKGTTTEPGFDIIWNPEAVKNLQLRFRGNFPNDFSNNTGYTWDEYRLIANYNF